MRFQQTSHIFDSQDVNALVNLRSDQKGIRNACQSTYKLLSEIKVILQSIFGLCFIANISRVAHCRLHNTSSFLCSIDAQLHVFKVIQRIENTDWELRISLAK